VIAIRSGAVVGAFTDSGLNNISAMRELFLAPEGSCRVELDGTVKGQPIGSTIALTLDGCKLLDEWNELSPERLALSSHTFTMTPELEESLESVRSVIDAMHDGATLIDAVDQTSSERSVVLPHIMRLVEGGVVELPVNGMAHLPLSKPVTSRNERPAPKAEIATEKPLAKRAASNGHRDDDASVSEPDDETVEIPEDIDELLVTARSHIKANELDAAERMLRVAIERYPNDRVLAQNMRHLALRRMQQST
jgi:hypothetical protein